MGNAQLKEPASGWIATTPATTSRSSSSDQRPTPTGTLRFPGTHEIHQRFVPLCTRGPLFTDLLICRDTQL
ncbi:hypothetical protein A3O06_16070 [Mycobacteroides abscessus]|nr:hypothetical protein A3O06_16070 [Mycobacteroides abscessus]